MADQKAKIDVNRQKTGLGVDESGNIRQIKQEDTTDRLLVSATTTPSPPTTITDGRKVVAVAGTRIQLLSASTVCKSVVVQGLYANGGVVVIGGVTVIAAAATRVGFTLQPGQGIEIQISNVNKLYIDAETAGWGVSFFYLN